jgi:putative tryptophan/tyrosine transport system substrate-binding protein
MKIGMRREATGTSKIIRIFGFALCTLLIALCSLSPAQQSRKIPRIGFLLAVPASTISTRVEAFRQGLRELGYIEGKNIVIEWRSTEGKADRLSALAAELVRLKVDVIVSGGPPPTRSAKQATATIPIVMGYDDDPVGSGFVASLSHPGGNITGLATLAPEVSGKQMELLKEILPRLSRLAVFENASQPGHPQALREITLAADAFGVRVQSLEIREAKDIDNAFQAVSKAHADAVLVVTTPLLTSQRRQWIDLATKNHLPTIFGRPEYVEDGGLVFYGVSYTDLFRRAASYVDKILKGAKPADLPVEQPTKFEFVINLKTAKQIGLTIPPNVLARADRVIK